MTREPNQHQNRELRAVFVIGLALATVCVASLGCETTPSNTEKMMGSSFESTRAQMLSKRPDAFGADSELATLPGTDAQGVLENYRESQTVEAQRDRRDNSGLIDLRE